MSASARFLLEFQATGDQEVVNKIREVGAAGKEAATDLESLQGIQDPFAAVGQGAEGAIGPITEVGSATEELGGVFGTATSASEDFGGALTGMNTEVEGMAGGLTEANTLVGDFGGSAETASGSASTLGQSTQGAIGAFVGLGGALGSATSLAFRMQDAQLRLDKAQLKAARSTETARKAQLAFNNLLGTATTNTDAIAAANDRLSTAQAHLNELIAAGVTSGPEYAAAQQEVADATAALKTEFVEGGGSAEKFDAAMGKLLNSNEAAAISLKNLEKIQRETTQQWYELPFAIAGVTGTLIQSISSMGKFAPIATKVSGILKGLPALFTGGAAGAAGLATAVGRIGPIVLVAVEGFKAFNASLALFQGLVAAAAGEGEKAAQKLKESFDLTKLAGGFGSSGAVMELIGKLGLDKTFDDVAKAQKKLDEQNKKTAASTKELAGASIEYGNAADTNMVAVEGVRTAIAYLPGSIDPANKSMVEMGTELGTAAEQMQLVEGGVMSMNATLNESIDANALEARALLDVRDAALQNEEAISANHLAYAQSVDKVLDLNAVMSDSTALHEAVQTAVNNTTASLMEQAIQLEAASQSADSLSQQQMRLDNAFKSGVVSIKEWANGLAEAKQEQEGQSAALAAMGAKWSDIPPFVERNIETLKLFGVAAKQGGEAAKKAAEMAADAWRDATSEMGGEIDGLADILMKGGDKMGEATAKWFEGIEQKLGRELTATEATAVRKLADMQVSTEQAINDWQFGQLMGESVAQGGAELATAFDAVASTMEGGMKEAFSRAAQIVRQDPSLAAAVNEVMANAGKTAPAALLGELNALLPPGLKDSATKAGAAIPGALDPAAATAGQSAALTLSQEFAAAGTHIAAVMAGIEENMKIVPAPIPLDIDITPAGKTLVSLVNTISSIKQSTKPPVDVDITPAGKTLVSLVNTMSSIKQTSVPIFNINVAPAIASLNKVRSLLGGVKTGQAGININPAPAIAAIKKVITEMAKIKQSKIPPVNVNTGPALNAIRSLVGRLNALPNIKRTITYTYRIVGSRPNPPNLNRTITYRYRTVGTRPAQTGMHENLSQDTLIAAHRGERVDITPGTISTNENRTAIIPATGQNARPINIMVRGDVNGKELIRFVKFNLMEGTGGVM